LLLETVDLDPRSADAYAFLGQAYAAQGATDEALAACDRALQLAPEADSVISTCGRVYAVAGRRANAVALLDGFQPDASGRRYRDPYYAASLAASIDVELGANDRVLQWLNRAYDERSANLCAIRVNRAFERVRSDPRFQDLLRRMGFPN
jgi:tetratricopeptide (TPR) repeat protein